ncbi:MAG: GNAT family N-acetyltransferase [Lachnospiraceae bacterium]|nr:GNAT family N-acetyltransferase [Lachnospiraceae bacterium]
MLEADEISRELFRNFERHQVVEDCWRRENGEWVIRKDPFTDQWSEEDYAFLVTCLQRTVRTGGVLFAAFADRQLKGFVSVEPELFGKNREYMDLSSLHVSEELRGRGIGRKLLYLAADWAKKQGAGKLYLSTHSAVETQAFYRAMGCREAMEYHRGHVEAEPYDIQMELELSAVVNNN